MTETIFVKNVFDVYFELLVWVVVCEVLYVQQPANRGQSRSLVLGSSNGVNSLYSLWACVKHVGPVSHIYFGSVRSDRLGKGMTITNKALSFGPELQTLGCNGTKKEITARC